ncbi:serine/arginine repetitive matrix protein 3 isoform X1 [Mauremys reevesii]|uniref:serine/arginine repetitive matrix protein 3 isoform X1 n=1 Tax=Mauremys reevesii TaxID=260615 RepID=UPI00193F707E|nr:serine/arginine repetitive matrix protein 3 isoform X1 [Mauremys reevesii]
MALYNNGAKMPSPQEAANGFPQPGASGTWHKPEEEVRLVEPSLVKKAHREILDHERKRRVELKCMELQEMMEEQGYSEEEIRQKVGTFRQMLMEKEGVLTREDQHGRQIVIENHHMEEYAVEYPAYGEGCLLPCDCPADCYQDHCSHREHRLKRRMSSSASPPPKKKKKKKSGHRRSRKKRKPGSERSCDSSSPLRKEKKKKNGKKHRRDRSESGSRKKRRRRSRSPKNKRKEKTKERKRSPSNSPARRCHRHSSCSSHSASLSSDYSHSKSPGRLTPKHREDGHKPSSLRSSRSPSSSRTWHSRSATPHQNGHKGSAQNGRHSHGTPGEKQQDKRLDSASSSPRGHVKPEPPSPRSKGGRRGPRSPRSVSPEKGGRCSGGDKYRRRSRSASLHKHKGRSKGQASAQKASPHSLSHTDYSSDSEGSACSHPYPAARGAEKNHGAHLKKVKDRHHRGRPNSCSQSPVKHSRHNSERRKSLSRSSSWSSSGSPSKSRSRSREKRAARSRSQSPLQKKNASREKDNEPRTRHSDTDPARARRRSRSYSPIRKRRRDSPSFMEPRRITSARKRPIPYYRPSPSSSSSLSSYSYSRSYSRSYDSYSTSRSRTRSPQSRSRTPSPSPSYNSRSSSESAGF